jgi:hypothetical protein
MAAPSSLVPAGAGIGRLARVCNSLSDFYVDGLRRGRSVSETCFAFAPRNGAIEQASCDFCASAELISVPCRDEFRIGFQVHPFKVDELDPKFVTLAAKNGHSMHSIIVTIKYLPHNRTG